MPGTSAAVGLKQTQGQLGADELFQVEIGGNRKGIDVELEVVIDTFLAVEALHDQGRHFAKRRWSVSRPSGPWELLDYASPKAAIGRQF